MTKHLLLLFFLNTIVCQSAVFAQSQPSTPLYRKEIVPLSPTAAALGKYVDAPVSLAMGTPEISIPLYEVQGRDLNLPISLTYHAGGFKVDELASWVGLGWSLNAGGMVGRTIRGLADNGSYMPNFGNKSLPLEEGADCHLFTGLTNSDSGIDGQPDLYFFNFSGLSGKFIVTDKVHLLPQQALDVKGSPAGSWEIKAPNGDTYLFGAGQNTQERTLVRGADVAESSVTSWLLTRIISANGTDTIHFDYKPVTYMESITMSENRVYELGISSGTPMLKFSDINGTVTTMYGMELERIRFSQGRVEFISNTIRMDVRPRDPSDSNKPVQLDAMKVYDKQNNLVKHFIFHYDYFSVGNVPEDKRLKLLQVEEVPVQNVPAKVNSKLHRFTYIESPKLPSRGSKAQDHWGYFNNSGTNNGTLIPTHELSDGRIIEGANRNTDTVAVKANLLSQITYPTGGHVRYTYEAHDYSFVDGSQVKEELVMSHTQPAVIAEAWDYDANKNPTNMPIYTSPNFTIDVAQDVTVNINVYTETTTNTSGGETTTYGYLGAMVEILDQSGFDNHVFRVSDNGTRVVHLMPGTYRLKATATSTSSKAFISLLYKTFTGKTIQRKWAGGVRVKKTELYDGIDVKNNIVKTYSYNKAGSADLSSGALNREPNYRYSYTQWEQVGPNTTLCDHKQFSLFGFMSSAQNVSGSGSHMSYGEVTVMEGKSGDNGSSTYYFTNYADYPDAQGGRSYPFAPATDLSWRRGLLLLKVDKDKNGVIQKETLNHYTRDQASKVSFTGYKVVVRSQHPCQNYNFCTQNSYPTHEFYQDRYESVSEFQYLDRTEERLYSQDGSGQYVSQLTTYHYDRLPVHTLLTRAEQSLGSGKTLVTRYTYPQDYDFPVGAALSPEALAIEQMKANHIISPVVEKTIWEQTAGGMALVGGEYTEFSTFHASTRPMLMPHKVYYLELAEPVEELVFSPAAVVIENGVHRLKHDNLYALRTSLLSYSTSGNLLELQDSDHRRFVYLWGYRNQLPVAEIENASLAQVETALGGTATLKTLSSSTVLSQQQTEELIALRARLPEARVRNFTYRPLYGISSVFDANGRSNSYEYDGMGRLRLIRDQDGNIVEAYEYQFSKN